jgi:hypothetical protein
MMLVVTIILSYISLLVFAKYSDSGGKIDPSTGFYLEAGFWRLSRDSFHGCGGFGLKPLRLARLRLGKFNTQK